ncbi:hypothetical protein LSAT2_023885 [Lamellibrachia satsuma]|nr:hypothetical protein LSAT2_023885 [Lamellibrachia satsuma]
MIVYTEHKITGSDLAGISMHLLDKMDIMTTEDRELILAELYKLQHPAGPSLEQVIHEQRSYCSDYSEHSSSTPREELTEPVGLPAVRRQPCETDADTTEIVLQLDVENKSSMEDRQTRQSDKTSTQDPLLGKGVLFYTNNFVLVLDFKI